MYDGIQNDWVFEEINLSDYLGSSILARFKLITDSEVTRDGFYFDDLKFNSISNDPLNVQNIDFKNSFDIFPNPVADQLTIKTASRDYKTTVYSILGQEIMATRNASGTSYINFTELSEGIYFLRLENDRFNTTFKIIKQ